MPSVRGRAVHGREAGGGLALLPFFFLLLLGSSGMLRAQQAAPAPATLHVQLQATANVPLAPASAAQIPASVLTPIRSKDGDGSIEATCVEKRRIELQAKIDHGEGAKVVNGVRTATLPCMQCAWWRSQLEKLSRDLCAGWLQHHFPSPGLADRLIALRDSVDAQKDTAYANFKSSYSRIWRYQVLVGVIGAAATLLATVVARRKKKEGEPEASLWEDPAFYSVVLTAAVTVVSSLVTFADTRGDAERNAKVWVVMGELQSRIDDALMAEVSLGEKRMSLENLNKQISLWEKERSDALKTAADHWQKAIEKMK
jgi:hypothetical protein